MLPPLAKPNSAVPELETLARGGLFRYGIPNMKLDKETVQRRVDLMTEEGIEFVTNAAIGTEVDVNVLRANSDALVLAMGSPRAPTRASVVL